MRTEVTVSDTLRNLIKAILQKQQDQDVEKVGHLAEQVRKPATHGFQGGGGDKGFPFTSKVAPARNTGVTSLKK